MQYFLGIDLGTGSVKTVLFDENGLELAQSAIEYPVYSPYNGWSEQIPSDWEEAALQTMKNVLWNAGVPSEDVKGIGLSGQMMGLVMMDENQQALRNAILWNDSRTTEACAKIASLIPDEKFMQYACNPARPGLTAAKIQWVKDNEPETWAKCRQILLPKDYLRWYLTGDYATEVSDASATQLFDIPNRKWAKEMLDYMDISEDMVPKAYESIEITGTLRPEIAKELGLSEEVFVVGGASDNAAAAVGTGVVVPGRAMTTIGTSGTVFACTDTPDIDAGKRVYTFCMAVPGTWHFMGSVNSAGNSLKWYRNTFYPNDTEYEQINADAMASAPGSHNLVYLPYLTGEQSPHFNLRCRAGFVGISNIHTRADMTRSVMEGITFALRDILTAIRESGSEPDSVRMCGGGSKSPFWRQLMADIYDLPVALPDMNSENAAALGVAILAMVGGGVYPTVADACSHIIKMREETYEPNEDTRRAYDDTYKAFDHLYAPLVESWAEILDI